MIEKYDLSIKNNNPIFGVAGSKEWRHLRRRQSMYAVLCLPPMISDYYQNVIQMYSILDNFDVIEETEEYIKYIDSDGALVIESFEDDLIIDETEEPLINPSVDPENPKLVEFRSLLFDQVYHQLDIREWVI